MAVIQGLPFDDDVENLKRIVVPQGGYIGDEEQYMLDLGDRQDFRINLTSMSDETFKNAVLSGLERCNVALELNLDKAKLIKTGHYRVPKLQKT